jgi:hypothetical protein
MRHILLIAVIASLAGCGSEMVPGVVVEGTTAMVAIPMEFEAGYGRRLSAPGLDPEVSPTLPYASVGPLAALEDLQRGELVFTLYRTTGEKVTVLRLSYITRVAQDPSSRRAQGTLQFHEDHFQPVAFVDIPTGIVPDAAGQDEFEIAVTRWRRSSANVDTFERVEQGYDPQWVGWGNHTAVPSISQRIPITIVDAPEAAGMEVPHYSPKYAWGPSWAASTRPMPKRIYEMPSRSPSSGSRCPTPRARRTRGTCRSTFRPSASRSRPSG